MGHRKKIVKKSKFVDVQFQNIFAQLTSLVSARKQHIVIGRGGAKTTDIQVERLIDVIYDMPGAPIAWIADTFSNLTTNILPSVIEGLERRGFKEGVHYVIEKEPPKFSIKETAKLPKWLKPHFWKPFNRLVSHKRTIIFYTGTNIRFGSLDRPSTLAGASYVFVFGDEVKYFKKEKIANLKKAIRGYKAQYGNSVFYRGESFTTDMPNVENIGEHDWILNERADVDVKTILDVIKVGIVMNEAAHEHIAAKIEWEESKTPANLKDFQKKAQVAKRWKIMWEELRKTKGAQLFYLIASSYINADILTLEWFEDALSSNMGDFETAVLSCKSKMISGNRFYAGFSEKHLYTDGINETAYEELDEELTDSEDCSVLKYLNKNKRLEIGVDFGLMCSMAISQYHQNDNHLRVLKFIYTLSPEFVPQLAKKFIDYFAPMENKVVYVYYDRAGNAYKEMGRDLASELKRSIEVDTVTGKSTGWTAVLMSKDEGNIYQAAEYYFMQRIFAEDVPALPRVSIDAYAAKHVKVAIESARTRLNRGIIYKDKRSEKLPIDRLPLESTNPTDAFKYLLMRRAWREIVKNHSSKKDVMNPSFSPP